MKFLHKPFRYTFKNATLFLVIINAVVFFVTNMFPRLSIFLGLSVAGCIGYGFLWQPLTYMFVHGGWMHLICNMIGLYCFGIMVEKAVGTKEFILMYFLCGIFDGLISMLIYYFTGQYGTLLVGASGAIYSILLFFSVFFPRSILRIWGIIPVPAPLLIVVYAIIEIGSQFTGARGNVAHLTHLTGFVLAWIYLVVRMGINPVKVWKDAYRM